MSLLRRHVYESNLIEEIRVGSGNPLFTSHLRAASVVAQACMQERLLDPTEIHTMLCKGTDMESFGGKIRTCGMRVGEKLMPKWENVPRLMEEWWSLVKESSVLKSEAPATLAALARQFHDEFLCIHPFEGGNGRTARLILNHLRLQYGLNWLVIEAREKQAYYLEIERTEEGFKAHYPDVYP